MASSDEVSPRPQLPSNFANELWQRYAAQQKRTMPKATAQPSSAEVSLEDYTSAFSKDPALVWQFYSYRRHCALRATPNKAHLALAELAKKKPDFFAISQNVDGLCQRANHPPENIQAVHGSLFSNRCTKCAYVENDNFADPLVPAFALPDDVDPSDAKFPLKSIHCAALLRPNVVWFGESLSESAVDRVDSWMLVCVGVPGAGYIHAARARGARIAVFNMEEPTEEGPTSRLREEIELLKEVIGAVPDI
ncbi:Sir2 family transcription regulator [Mycena leptocephala]|nr:Sir2 family transcription regulator [Mycena leptocephala]